MFIVSALTIGILLGLFGGGGSILAVPIFVYLFGFSVKLAVTTSLIIVGMGTLILAGIHLYRKNIDLLCTSIFALSGGFASFFASHFLLRYLNEHIQMVMYISVIILAIFLGFKQPKLKNEPQLETERNCPLAIFVGFAIGLVTAFTGVGGGFIIVPALTGLLKIPFTKAVGSSTLIIAMQSIIAASSQSFSSAIDWDFTLRYLFLVIIGTLFGLVFSLRLESEKLKKYFQIFLILLACFLLIKNFST